MPSPTDLLRFGYWPSRELSGEIPSPIRSPDQDTGAAVLNIACTQTGLPASRQRRLVDDWIRQLSTVPATTVVFSSKVPQDLFDAACAVPNLRALSIKWSSCRSLQHLKHARSLEALFLGSSPGLADLCPISELTGLKHLFLENVAGPVDLSFTDRLGNLKELGLAAARGRTLEVLTLEPLASLKQLEMLWLVSVRVLHRGLRPLHGLQNLKSLRTTIRSTSSELKALCAAVPSLQYFQPVG
jgi:hypothetical protein